MHQPDQILPQVAAFLGLADELPAMRACIDPALHRAEIVRSSAPATKVRPNITILSFICCPLREGRLVVEDNFRQSLCRRRGLLSSMRYVINLSEESDHLLRQFCDSGRISPSEGISPAEFLSAFVEDQLDELFARRERRKAGRKKNAQNAVQSAKEQAKAWSEATVATHTAVKALEKLVVETMANPKTARLPKSPKSFTCVSPGKCA